jgi:hypothetical protein
LILKYSYLNGCVNFKLALRKKYGLNTFYNRMLERRCGPRSEIVAVHWGRLQKQKIHNSYSLTAIIVIKLMWMRLVDSVECSGEVRNLYNMSARKHTRRNSLRRMV